MFRLVLSIAAIAAGALACESPFQLRAGSKQFGKDLCYTVLNNGEPLYYAEAREACRQLDAHVCTLGELVQGQVARGALNPDSEDSFWTSSAAIGGFFGPGGEFGEDPLEPTEVRAVLDFDFDFLSESEYDFEGGFDLVSNSAACCKDAKKRALQERLAMKGKGKGKKAAGGGSSSSSSTDACPGLSQPNTFDQELCVLTSPLTADLTLPEAFWYCYDRGMRLCTGREVERHYLWQDLPTIAPPTVTFVPSTGIPIDFPTGLWVDSFASFTGSAGSWQENGRNSDLSQALINVNGYWIIAVAEGDQSQEGGALCCQTRN